MRLAAMLCIALAVVALYMWWDARKEESKAQVAARAAEKAAAEAIKAEGRALTAEGQAKHLRTAAETKAKEEMVLRRTAEDAKAEATAAATKAAEQARIALGGKLAAQSILFADPSVNVPLDTAALLAIASYRFEPSVEARRGLLAPMSRLDQVRKILVLSDCTEWRRIQP